MRFQSPCLVALLAFALAPPALAAEEPEVQQKLEALEQRIRELEANADAAPPVSAPAAQPAVPAAKAKSADEPGAPGEEVQAEVEAGRRAKVIYRQSMNDWQAAAARAGDYTIDPDYRGFIPIPNTPALIKFNAKPRVDLVGDTANAGTDFRFVPALFPADQQDGWNMGMNANGSQLVVDARAPSVEGAPRFYYQNDFFGSNTSNMNYRLQHLYGQYQGVLAGFTFGVFEDPDAWPDTVDYEGTNSVVFARRALAQYATEFSPDWELTLSVEDPDSYVDLTGSAGANQRSRAPDTGFAVRWAPEDLGHLRFATIFRSIGSDEGAFGTEDVFGWGINASGSLAVFKTDTVQFWLVYGHGVGGMGNDTSFVNSDAAFSDSGNLKALEYYSTMIAYTHEWTPRWRSTATHGFVHLENAGSQTGDAYNKSHYASVNLMYQIFTRLQIGVEGLYGWREVKDDSTVDDFRVQVGLSWKLFN